MTFDNLNIHYNKSQQEILLYINTYNKQYIYIIDSTKFFYDIYDYYKLLKKVIQTNCYTYKIENNKCFFQYTIKYNYYLDTVYEEILILEPNKILEYNYNKRVILIIIFWLLVFIFCIKYYPVYFIQNTCNKENFYEILKKNKYIAKEEFIL